jgi:acyl transferase domain-containing protein/acyl carrier protein
MDEATHDLTGLEIAIIGMNGRFPGARNLKEFWENLKNGVESISFFSDQELEARGVSPEAREEPNYVRAKGLIDEIEYFDPGFFGFSPNEAEVMDPQLRILYQSVWEVLEIAGYTPETCDGGVGLYVGGSNNRWWEMKAFYSNAAELLGAFALDHLIDRDFFSTRLAHRLNLRGPAVTLKTACSSALVALDLACRSLLTGQCDIAIAGGASFVYLKRPGYTFKEGLIRSRDGHCRAFDENAHGVVFSDAVGVVALKRLQDAITDRDAIWAVIKGTAVNNDGSRKGTYEAPCVEGQAEVIRMAYHIAEVNPETVTYVETHGTGTIIGDPIEIEGLKRAFSTDKRHFCAVGSVKTNVGHTDTAAGITGFIKTVLALQHRLIPPSINFEKPNPKIDFENSPFYVNHRLSAWEPGCYPVLRAGVSSFGVGGTNVHVVLEEAPEPRQTSPGRPWQMIVLSGRTETALKKATENLAAYLKENPGVNLADAAYTLQVGRKAFRLRRMLVSPGAADTIRLLEAADDPSSPDFGSTFTATSRDRNQLVFMFSGQGAQYVNMGLDLYKTEPVFREEMDRCFEILKGLLDDDIKEILYPGEIGNRSYRSNKSYKSYKSHINQTEITQPVLFMFEYALAKLLMHWGIEPYAMIGHSIGEYVAACLSGVFSLQDGLRLVAARGKLMQQMPAGAMLSVSLPEEELIPLLEQHNQLALAAVNSPSLCVVSGPHHAIDLFENQCKNSGYNCRRLHTSHAFHSAMMGPVVEQFADVVGEIPLNNPKLPYISNLTGKWITVEDAVSPQYWAKHLRSTVRFGDGLAELLKDPAVVFIEVGPGRSLAAFVRKHTHKKPEHIILNLVKHPNENCPDDNYMLNNIGQLWLYGITPDWKAFYRDEQRQRIPLPTYPFDGQRFWVDSDPDGIDFKARKRKAKLEKNTDIKEWFYVPSWKRSPIPTRESEETTAPINWLFFVDDENFGEQLITRLKQKENNDRVTTVRWGAEFECPGNGEYIVNPRQAGDYQALIAELKKQDRIPRQVVHLWNISRVDKSGPGLEWDKDCEDKGFYSLIFLAQALGNEGIEEDIRVTVVTNNMQEVSGGELLCPRKATVLGPVKVIPTEYANIRCTNVDVVFPGPGTEKESRLMEQLLVELRRNTPDKMIAYRNNYRWVQTYEPFPLEKPGEKPPHLRNGGVYLVSGGLGGIGLVIAEHLVRSVKARLILIGRSALPRRDQWRQYLEKHDKTDKIAAKIRKLLELEKAGGEVMVSSADVTDLNRVQALVNEAEARYGTINGVFHAAGIPGGGMIQVKTREQADKVMAAKVKGTLVLNETFQNHPLDFFILCSSINAIVPLLGQVDYYAANAFLDAFAYFRNSTGETFTTSINWDGWQEVGMAVEAVKHLGGTNVPRESPIEDIEHPLFDRCIHKGPGQSVYESHFSLHQQWVMKEHRIAENGKGLVPGVTYLEMAREAFYKHTGNGDGIIEISDVYFLNPLMAGEGEEIETWLVLKKQPDHYEFLVQSRTDSNENTWQKHAVGKITLLEKDNRPAVHNLREIADKCSEGETGLSPESKEVNRGLLIFGPRWANIKQIRYGENQGLASLNLSEEFVPDLDVYQLHPALLDSATGFLFGHVGKSAYIPFSYKRLRLQGPLKSKMYSFNRLIGNGGPGEESLKFDITIMDEQGNELVNIEEFTMLQVTEGVKVKIREKENSAVSFPLPGPGEPGPVGEKKTQSDFLKYGILPSEGIEVFNRVLGETLSQVVVSTANLPLRLEKAAVSPSIFQGEELGKKRPAMTLLARPALSSTYVAPKTETEKMIAGIWQEFLGLEQIGIHDNFFEMGGDSLSIVQLNGKLKRVLNRDIPVAVMFKYLTIQSFVQYLEKGEEEEIVQEEEVDRTDELKKSKDRLKTRSKRR